MLMAPRLLLRRPILSEPAVRVAFRVQRLKERRIGLPGVYEPGNQIIDLLITDPCAEHCLARIKPRIECFALSVLELTWVYPTHGRQLHAHAGCPGCGIGVCSSRLVLTAVCTVWCAVFRFWCGICDTFAAVSAVLA